MAAQKLCKGPFFEGTHIPGLSSGYSWIQPKKLSSRPHRWRWLQFWVQYDNKNKNSLLNLGQIRSVNQQGAIHKWCQQFLTPSPQYWQFFVLTFGNFGQFLTLPLLPMANIVYGRPQISTLKLLWKNDCNAKQRPERLHLKVGDLKSDNQGLYPEWHWFFHSQWPLGKKVHILSFLKSGIFLKCSVLPKKRCTA